MQFVEGFQILILSGLKKIEILSEFQLVTKNYQFISAILKHIEPDILGFFHLII